MTGYPVPLQDGVPVTWVAIDVAKDAHVVLVESGGGRRQFRVANRLEELQALVAFLRQQPQPVRVAFEPTGVYHRPLAYQLVTAGLDVVLVASLACARYREARYTSWDKNDPKDAAVILELLKQGLTLRYLDPLVAGWHDIQEVAKTYWHVTLAPHPRPAQLADALPSPVLARVRPLLAYLAQRAFCPHAARLSHTPVHSGVLA